LAKYVVTSQSVTINSVDLSADCARAELVINSADVETTDFSSGGFVELQGGLKSGVLNLDFHADYASGGASETLEALVGTVVTFVLIAGGTSASTDTPSFSGSILINSFTPVAGAVGDLATFSVSFPTSGAITKATS
tara:strand:- start:1885 stop:2295 length:411 start_codon:yes stop_codon:yes gene_type:complete